MAWITCEKCDTKGCLLKKKYDKKRKKIFKLFLLGGHKRKPSPSYQPEGLPRNCQANDSICMQSEDSHLAQNYHPGMHRAVVSVGKTQGYGGSPRPWSETGAAHMYRISGLDQLGFPYLTFIWLWRQRFDWLCKVHFPHQNTSYRFFCF